MWHDSGIEYMLRDFFETTAATRFLYSDPAYRGVYGVIGAYVQTVEKALTVD
jgi:hypothetical protein